MLLVFNALLVRCIHISLQFLGRCLILLYQLEQFLFIITVSIRIIFCGIFQPVDNIQCGLAGAFIDNTGFDVVLN